MARQATAERPKNQTQAPQQAPAAQLPATQDQAKVHPLTVLKGQLEERQSEFAFVLPEHIPPQRFTRVCLTAVQMNPKLLAADRASFFNAALKAAQDGLLPDGREGAIVDYKDNKSGKILAQWMPMYQGLLKKVRNSGEFKWMTAQIVYEGDLFDHWIDQDGEHFKHEPAGISETPIKAYAAVTTKSGGAFVEVMTMKQIAKVRAASRVKSEYGPWAKWFDEMAKKTPFRRLAKRLPLSSDLDDLIRRDDGLYDFEGQREEAQVEQQDRRRLTTAAAFDAFAGGAQADDHDPETGEVVDDDFGTGEGQDDFGSADDSADVARQEAEQKAQREAAEKEEARKQAEAKAKEAEAQKAREAEAAKKAAAKKEDPISSGPQRAVGSQSAADATGGAAQPADDKGTASAGAQETKPVDEGAKLIDSLAGSSDEQVDGQADEERRWPHGAIPTNADEYESFAETKIADFTVAGEVSPWWKSKEQIDLRKTCGVSQEMFSRIVKKAQNRVAELSKK